jgi:hypothetical protein
LLLLDVALEITQALVPEGFVVLEPIVGGKTGIPDWLYDCGPRAMALGIVPTPGISTTGRKIVELGEVHRFKPLFNYIGGRVA